MNHKNNIIDGKNETSHFVRKLDENWPTDRLIIMSSSITFIALVLLGLSWFNGCLKQFRLKGIDIVEWLNCWIHIIWDILISDLCEYLLTFFRLGNR